MTLLELMQKYGTDKAVHGFHAPYGFLLEPHRRQVRTVLELGVKKGQSLCVWEEYFPQARIFGVDVEPMKAKYVGHNSERRHTFLGSQSDESVLAEVCAAAGGSFDFIIDDGSHKSDDQVASLQYLWRFLKPPHGIYAIEDTHAHVKFPEPYGNEGCRYPPMSDMLLAHAQRFMAEDGVRNGNPGICIYGAIALLLKGEEGPGLQFDEFVKDRRDSPP